MTPHPETTNETAEQWADRLIRDYSRNYDILHAIGCDPTGYHRLQMENVVAKIAAVYRDAQAMKLWREYALAMKRYHSFGPTCAPSEVITQLNEASDALARAHPPAAKETVK